MDGFSYHNIFETKGIEYLIIIAFLLLIIPFWIIINKEIPVGARIRKAIGVLTEGILRVPPGLLFSKNHTWLHLEKSGLAEVGIDDFLLHITGEVIFSNLREPGSRVRKGELLADLDHEGKRLRVYSPISGRIAAINKLISESPSAVSGDPYGKGWICRIEPSGWSEETSRYFLADEALEWMKTELQRFRDFVAGSVGRFTPEASMIILQDGGELSDYPLAGLPEEVWNDFQQSFLDLQA